ncbi:hypothetical protein FACS1894166_00650 [Bacilli bacterium]|nr:hypothetical protein FACS1894166_00650 [Bacilli bacterium]
MPAQTIHLIKTFGRNDQEISLSLKQSYQPIDGKYCSMTHSHNCGVLVYSDAPVGVDLEKMSPHPYLELIAKRYFTEAEIKLIVNTSNHVDTFYHLWCAKESVFKLDNTNSVPHTEIKREGPLWCCELTNQQRAYFHFEKFNGMLLCICSLNKEINLIKHA